MRSIAETNCDVRRRSAAVTLLSGRGKCFMTSRRHADRSASTAAQSRIRISLAAFCTVRPRCPPLIVAMARCSRSEEALHARRARCMTVARTDAQPLTDVRRYAIPLPAIGEQAQDRERCGRRRCGSRTYRVAAIVARSDASAAAPVVHPARRPSREACPPGPQRRASRRPCLSASPPRSSIERPQMRRSLAAAATREGHRMSDTATIVQKLWNYCNVLRDDGLSYQDYIEQLTFLLFLKMADEQTQATVQPAQHRPRRASTGQSLHRLDGDALEVQYRHIARGARQAAGHARRHLPQGAEQDPGPGQAQAARLRPHRQRAVDDARR